MADELKAEGLVFGGELQAGGLGLPPLLPAKFNFGRELGFIFQKGPGFFELPFKDVVEQGAIGTARGKGVEIRLFSWRG